MAFAIADRVQETTTTQGTGTVVLAGAVTGYQSFAVIGDTNTTYYTIADQSGANWEVGIGTYYLANTSLARTTILASSNSNTAVSFGLGTKVVFVTYPAEKAIYSNDNNVTTVTNFASGNVAITGGSISNVSLTNVTYSGLGTMSLQNANAVTITGGTIAGTGITSGNVTITGGTINGTTQNAGTYTNVTVNQGTINGVTLSNITYGGLGTMATQNANAVAITGGTINSTSQNAGTYTNVTITSGNINGTTQNAGTYTNVTVNQGTINGVTLSNITYGGLGTMSTQDANNVSITGGTIATTNVSTSNLIATGGTINSVIIGGSTPANGSFTNLTLTNQLIANASAGTAGQVLTTAGAGASPYWANATGGGGGSTGIGNSSILALNVNITANATINAGVNGFSVGPVNTANGVVVTITSGQRWVII